MIKGLIENECAGQNPLMKLATHFTASADSKLLSQSVMSQQQQQQQPPSQLFNPDMLVAEYLSLDSKQAARVAHHHHQHQQHHRPQQLAPRSFHMETLFKELKQIENSGSVGSGAVMAQTTGASASANPLNKVIGSGLNSTNAPASTTSADSMANDWSQEYWSSLPVSASQKSSVATSGGKIGASLPPVIMDSNAFKWSADYLSQNESTIFDEAWENLFFKNNLNTVNGANLSSMATNSKSDVTLAESNNKLNEEMMKTANELLDSMQDSRFSETEFLSFVRNLSVNAAAINSEKTKNGINEESSSSPAVDLADEWVNEFQQASNSKSAVDGDASYWNDLQQEWNNIAYSNPDHPWLDDFQKVFDTYKTYEFDKENPLRGHENAFDEGLERLKQHDIVNAVLLFEVAVQRDPTHMLAWQYLGTTQVENEQDAQAIRALRKCLELKPDNLIALSTLATSYTNESMQRLAFDSLIKWLKHHPTYSHLLRNDEQAVRLLQASDLMNQVEASSPFYMASLNIVDVSDFLDLQEVFLRAVRESNASTNIDPDLQCCLGVLFHLSGEYDKAADCFKTALQVKPTDHLLWNKLGATYANNNRNEEAIDAYYQALKLCPGFVRARYNLGIGCMNLGAYKESVEHFLTALVQQSQATLTESSSIGATDAASSTSTKIQQMSETIWSTLRLALSFLNRSDLYSACLNKDLDKLRVEFKI